MDRRPTYIWHLPDGLPPISDWARDLGISPLVAAILARRGLVDPGETAAFLDPRLAQLKNPADMLGMAEAVDLLAEAARDGRCVGVYTDYDVDGLTSAACLDRFLTHLGVPHHVYHPNRVDDGYGFRPSGVDELLARGAEIIVTADCGISDHDTVRYAQSRGARVVVTDHHRPGPTLPAADAVVNPLRPGCPSGGEPFAGVGVVFCLLAALRARLRDLGRFDRVPEPDLKDYLDLVALGTVADIVPLTGQNRILAAAGLEVLDRTEKPGLMALKQVSRVAHPLTAYDISFKLAPRINAAGRVADPRPALDLLTATDPVLARRLADEVDLYNNRRKTIQDRLYTQVAARINAAGDTPPSAIVLHDPQWHPGVLGIVASKVVKQYRRPVILLTSDQGLARGSGRAPEGFDLFTALDHCSEWLSAFGGHKVAAGLSLPEKDVAPLAAQLGRYVDAVFGSAPFIPTLNIDAVVPPGHLDERLYWDLARLGPFGEQNPEPLLALCGARVEAGQLLRGRHLKLWLDYGGQSIQAIGFNLADRAPEGRGPWDLAGHLRYNHYLNDLDFQVVDLRPSPLQPR